MPRANRYLVAGPAYHVTHRCHNRAFLFRFARDRDAYRTMLRDQIRARGDVEVLTYCITSNHVHLLLTSRGTDEAISALMQALEGEFAQFYNRRKKRTGAFWGGRFHATMIDSGEYTCGSTRMKSRMKMNHGSQFGSAVETIRSIRRSGMSQRTATMT